DVGPRERGSLTFAPGAQVGKPGEVLKVFRKMHNHSFKLRTFKESLTHIVFREPRDVRRTDDFAALDSELEGLPQQLSLAIDSARPRAIVLPPVNIGVNALSRDVHSPKVTEGLADRLQMGLELSQSSAAFTDVFLFKRIQQFVDMHLFRPWRERSQPLAF